MLVTEKDLSYTKDDIVEQLRTILYDPQGGEDIKQTLGRMIALYGKEPEQVDLNTFLDEKPVLYVRENDELYDSSFDSSITVVSSDFNAVLQELVANYPSMNFLYNGYDILVQAIAAYVVENVLAAANHMLNKERMNLYYIPAFREEEQLALRDAVLRYRLVSGYPYKGNEILMEDENAYLSIETVVPTEPVKNDTEQVPDDDCPF